MTDQQNDDNPTRSNTETNHASNPKTIFSVRVWEFWRRNQIIFLQLPIMLIFLFGSYVLLKSWDSRIGVEGFGDIFGYALNGVRVTLIIFTAWWMKKWCLFDLHDRTELDLFNAAKTGDRSAFWLRVVDRVEWLVLLRLATYWYTR